MPLRFPQPAVAIDSMPDRPMQMALSGNSGTTIGPDYRGERVLAAYTLIAPLGLGMVMKIDMHEIRRPFLLAGLLAAAVTGMLIVVGVLVAVKISNPILTELDEKARLELELEFARTVQLGLLPDAPPQHPAM